MASYDEKAEREQRAERLRAARARSGFRGPTAVANALQISVDTYKAHEQGRNGFGVADSKRYSKLFEVSNRWLYLNEGDPEDIDVETSTIQAPLISWVSAGALLKPDDPVDIEGAAIIHEPDLDPGGDWIALRVDGDSMNRISPHDSIIFVNRKDRRLVPNACYVIGDGEGGATYKRYRPPNTWEPVSTNKMHQPFVLEDDQTPDIIGRVRRTRLSL